MFCFCMGTFVIIFLLCPQEKRTVPSGDLFDDLQRYTFVRKLSPPAWEPRDISLWFWDTCVGAEEVVFQQELDVIPQPLNG